MQRGSKDTNWKRWLVLVNSNASSSSKLSWEYQAYCPSQNVVFMFIRCTVFQSSNPIAQPTDFVRHTTGKHSISIRDNNNTERTRGKYRPEGGTTKGKFSFPVSSSLHIPHRDLEVPAESPLELRSFIIPDRRESAAQRVHSLIVPLRIHTYGSWLFINILIWACILGYAHSFSLPKLLTARSSKPWNLVVPALLRTFQRFGLPAGKFQSTRLCPKAFPFSPSDFWPSLISAWVPLSNLAL